MKFWVTGFHGQFGHENLLALAISYGWERSGR